MDLDSSKADKAELWKLIGRDNPAGKALYAIYNGNSTGKEAGQRFTKLNKKRHEQKLAQGWQPAPLEQALPAPARPKVAVPRVGRPAGGADSEEQQAAARLAALIPRRRPGTEILAEVRREEEWQREQPLPRPAGPLLDEAAKQRAALMMEYRGKPPAEALKLQGGAGCKAAAGSGSPRRPLSERERLEARFAELSSEVEEREGFLRDMQALRSLKQEHVASVRFEVQQRVMEMRAIDARLQQLQAGR